MAAISVTVSSNGFSSYLTPTLVVASNANRKYLWLQNVSTEGQIIYLKYGTASGPSALDIALVNQGVRINPNGGMFVTAAQGWFTATCIGGGSAGQDSGLLVGWEL